MLEFGGDERLLRFVESEWPPVPGECLLHWACRDDGYADECASREGPCGHRFYTAWAHRPDLTALYRRADARRRWLNARREWLRARGLPYDDVWLDDVGLRRRELRAGLAHVDLDGEERHD